MREKGTLILGAGLSGISTAYHLDNADHLVVEKSDHPGGLCTSEHKNGFTFDQTGHWLHLAREENRALFSALFPDDRVRIERKTHIFSHGVYTLYPFQSNTYGLPPQVVRECVAGFVKALRDTDKSRARENFHEWCMAYLGEGIAKHFMIPYNSKLYTVHPKEMASHWCDRYVPKPTLAEVIEGAVTAPDRKVGYNASFFYPARGGIGEFPKRLFSRTDPANYLFNAFPTVVDIERRVVTLSTGEQVHYRHLVSSIPLRDLLGLVTGPFAPTAKAIAARMQVASVSYLNIGLKRPAGHPGHWFYIPEEGFMPYRVGSFSNIHPPLAPAGCGSLYVEYTHRGPFADTDRFIAESIRLLVAMGMIAGEDDIEFMDHRCIENGYVIFHREYFDDMATVSDLCGRHGIHLIGRYGRWTYNAMEDAVSDGRETANKILSGQGGPV